MAIAAINRMADQVVAERRRYGLAIAAAAFAVMALGNGIDRIAAKSPSLTGYVPAIFADQSLRIDAAKYLANSEYEAGKLIAAKAIAKAPVDPPRVSLLGTAVLGANEVGRANQLFLVAGQLGWREPATQIYWREVARARGDWDVAAMRLDALLRVDPTRANIFDDLAPFLDQAEGRNALIARLETAPAWSAAFFNPSQGISAEQLAARAEIFVSVKDGARASCEDASNLAKRLIKGSQIAAAHGIWTGACATQQGGLIDDPDFRNWAGKSSLPFGWTVFADGATRIRKLPDSGGLSIDSSAPFNRRFARQLLVLDPGAYQFSWREQSPASRPAERIAIGVSCGLEPSNPLPARQLANGKTQATFSMPRGCEGAYLSLFLRAGEGLVKISELELVPVN